MKTNCEHKHEEKLKEYLELLRYKDSGEYEKECDSYKKITLEELKDILGVTIPEELEIEFMVDFIAFLSRIQTLKKLK